MNEHQEQSGTSTEELKARHALLTEKLLSAQQAYHAQETPEMSDEDYDALMRELQHIEETLGISSKASEAIGATEQGVTRAHPTPMLSLGNTFSESDIMQFGARLGRKLHGVDAESLPYTVEYKLDGLSANLVYENGTFQWGATRGDGSEGEDITAQLRMMGIPETINMDGTVEVRGEIYMPRSALEAHNASAKERGERVFANTRNAAAGSLRKGTEQRVAMLKLAIWGMGSGAERIGSQHEILQWAREQGFHVAPGTVRAAGLAHASRSADALAESRDQQDFDVDGAVIKVDSVELQREAGRDSRAPAWATARKFAAQQVTTKLRSVIVTTGRTGKLTPVADLEPVKLEGSTVSKATLNNADYLKALDIHEGDTVTVQKAAGVIPQIVNVITALRPKGAQPVRLPDTCPECGHPATREEGEAGTFCRNPECPAQTEARLRHVVSRDVLDIQGLGDTVISALHERGLRHFTGLYTLSVQDLATLEVSAGTQEDGSEKKRPLGEKTAQKIYTQIQESKTAELWRFIRALGIPMTGKGTSTRLAEVYPGLAELRDAATSSDGEAVIAQVRDVGALTAASICNYFRNNPRIVETLYELGVTPVPSARLAQGDALSGMNIVVTGSLSAGREDIENWLRAQGASVSGSVTKKTTHLIAGEKAGGKLAKAEQLGVTILDEAAAAALCKERGVTWLQ